MTDAFFHVEPLLTRSVPTHVLQTPQGLVFLFIADAAILCACEALTPGHC